MVVRCPGPVDLTPVRSSAPATSPGMSQLLPRTVDATLPTAAAAAPTTALYFSATWCGPCRSFGPLLERVVTTMGDRVALVKVDVDASPELAVKYGVRSVPTVVVLRDGELVARNSGTLPEGAVRRLLDAAG